MGQYVLCALEAEALVVPASPSFSAVGVSLPAHCTAIGKALLAGLTDGQVERLLPERLPAETSDTITVRTELLADLEQVRATGIAYDREELAVGISAVGAAIRDAGAVVAALSIPVPTARFAGQEERLAGMLLRTCAEVSATLGANGHARS
jgi:DNA-binding IclR family transcriptional regulator